LVSLVAAQTVRTVIATDISPIAVRCAKGNVKINKLEDKIEVRQGHLFDPIGKAEIFDVILFNPPYLPSENELEGKEGGWLEKSWNGGECGRTMIDPFIKKCKSYLKPSGNILLVQSSLSDISRSCELLKAQGFQVEIRASKSFFFEKIHLIHAWFLK
jgi:release factor glutamine methyltransferase